ncbi:hypothetical protein V6N13_116638 [Hibiscus sabdariffa]
MIGLWAYSNTIATENAHAARDVQDATTMGTRTRDDLASASPTTVRSSKAADATAITVSDVATERVSHPAAPTEPSLSPTPVRSSKADAPEIPVGDAAPEGVSHPAAPTELTVSAHVIEMLQPEGGKNKGTEGGLVSTLDHEAPVKAPAIATSSSRVSKRSLQGKYEVCTPIQPKRSRIGSCSGSDNKNAGMSSLNSSTELFRVVSTFTAKSDHCLLLMDSSPMPTVGGDFSRLGNDYFRYDNCWVAESDFVDRVHSAWSHTSGSAIDKLSAVGGPFGTGKTIVVIVRPNVSETCSVSLIHACTAV